MKPGLRIKKIQIWGDFYLIYDARNVSKFSQVARALSSQVLSVAKDVDSTATLSSLFQCLYKLLQWMFHFINNYIWARLHYPWKKNTSAVHRQPQTSLSWGSITGNLYGLYFKAEASSHQALPWRGTDEAHVSSWRKLSVQEQKAVFIPKKL